MTRRAEIKQADANRIAKAAALANVKAEIKLPNGITVTFAPNANEDAPLQAAKRQEIVL